MIARAVSYYSSAPINFWVPNYCLEFWFHALPNPCYFIRVCPNSHLTLRHPAHDIHPDPGSTPSAHTPPKPGTQECPLKVTRTPRPSFLPKLLGNSPPSQTPAPPSINPDGPGEKNQSPAGLKADQFRRETNHNDYLSFLCRFLKSYCIYYFKMSLT